MKYQVPVRFNGRPEEFGTILRQYRGEDGTIHSIAKSFYSGTDPSSLVIQFFKESVGGFGKCVAKCMPGGLSGIAVYVPDRRADDIMAVWNEIYEHLQRCGLFEAN